jgi:flagellar biosynthesis protein FlhF
MNHKRFWGRDMSEALRAVRSSLGADALIMDTKNLPDDRGGGIEVTALTDGPAGDDDTTAEPVPMVKPQNHPMEELRRELAALKSMLGWLAPGLNHKDQIVSALVNHGVTPETVTKLSNAMQRIDGGDERERWYKAIASLVLTGGQIRAKGDQLALIGPAGAGKTASLIKLTIFESQRRACRVGWVNLDQRPLNTGDPLAVYAGILGVQYERAGSRKELKQSLAQLAQCDLVLVDTPGVNPRDKGSVKELSKLLEALPDLRRTLLLSAATNDRDLAEWVAAFRHVGADALFFSKLDESRYFGPLLNTTLGAGLPVSYITLGQNLAGDLEIAKPEIFASLLLTGAEFHD